MHASMLSPVTLSPYKVCLGQIFNVIQSFMCNIVEKLAGRSWERGCYAGMLRYTLCIKWHEQHSDNNYYSIIEHRLKLRHW